MGHSLTYKLTPEKLADMGFDLTGLTVRPWEESDMPLLQEWWSRRNHVPFPRCLIPPLGVLVEDFEGPAGMVFCYECYGCPVAFIDHAFTRNGMALHHAASVLGFAIAACMDLAGKGVVPPCEYMVFRASTFPGGARFLTRLGFGELDGGTPQRSMAFINN